MLIRPIKVPRKSDFFESIVMDINTNTFSQNVRDLAQADDKKTNGPMGQKVSEMAHAKKEMNAAILQSAVDVNINAGNDSLSLVLKAALDGINNALEESTGEEYSLQAAYDSGIDVSPEATASRIASLSTAFFGQYQESHPELELEEALTSFVDIISGGIDKGFGEAREILDGLGVLGGDIADNIDKTYELVQEGLAAFRELFEFPPKDELVE